MPALSFEFEPEKFVEASVYLTDRCPDMTKMKLFKLLFFADKKHLLRYGRPILGARYIAMKDGPVPSQAYDILKNNYHHFHEKLAVSGYEISPKQSAGIDSLSDSDIEILSEVCSEYGGLTAAQLRKQSHDEKAWSECPRNTEIDYSPLLDEADSELIKIILDDQELRNFVNDVSLSDEPVTA